MKTRQFTILIIVIIAWFIIIYTKQIDNESKLEHISWVVDRNYHNLYNLRLDMTWPRDD
jgi:hypothetical protein